jgi:hypothetical protein
MIGSQIIGDKPNSEKIFGMTNFLIGCARGVENIESLIFCVVLI